MNNKAVFGCLLAFLFLALVISVGINFAQLGLTALAVGGDFEEVKPIKKFGETLVQEGKRDADDRVVQIDLEGIITSSEMGGFLQQTLPMVDTIKRALAQAIADDRVKAVVLRIDSPGGEVTASDTLYAAVKEAAAKKPVVVFMDSVAASGGYYIACGATKIVATETTLTGSIGVIMESFSYHGLFDKVGLGTNTFASGAFKDTLSGARPMREDEKAYINALVAQMYDRFLGIVAAARKQDAALLKSTVADGRVLIGREALEKKLVDQIGYIEDAYKLARDLGKAKDAMIVRYESQGGFLELLASAKTSAKSQKVEIDIAGGLLPKLQSGRAYYLPTSFTR